METYRKASGGICLILAVGFSLFELYTVGFGILSPFAQRATMLAFASVLVFLLKPAARWPERGDMSPPARLAAIAWDALAVGAAVASTVYLIVQEDALADRSGAETQLDLIIAAIGPAMLLEMVRRAAGRPLFFVTLGVIVYAYLGDVVLVALAALAVLEAVRRLAGWRAAAALAALAAASLALPAVRAWLDPSSFPFRGEAHDRMAAYLWLTSEGTFGTISAIMSEFIFIFILFAALLEATGTGQILINLAFALTGRFRGGPAQAAVASSSMFGMVSGSTMANVVSTGTFTIPLMIRTGFSRVFAGAVEAVASCGGQIVPPIMGASVFIMAELIEVPYVFLMAYALIPAFLYYFSLSASIYFESCRLDLRPLKASEIPDAGEQVRRGGYLLIPVAILLASIMSGETPGLAGFKAVVSLVVMVDLVRSLRWARAGGGARGAALLGAAAALALALAFGPWRAPAGLALGLPLLGQVAAGRVALFAAGAAFALFPPLRGLPVALPIGLALARWKIPSELFWLGQLPYVGMLLPAALAAGALWLISLPVREGAAPEEGGREGADESARALGRAVFRSLETGAKNALSLVAATSAIGLIVGLLVLVALGVRISILVTEVASTSLFLAFFLVMVASLIMGMGLPTIAAYLLLVIVVAPSITQLGAPLIAAHMFIFYFGVISSITPPVALAAYAASGISAADPMRTGFTACRLALTAFIVPYLFVYYPELLLQGGGAWEVGYRLAVSCAGIIALSMATMGYGLAALGAGARALLAAAALLFFLDGGGLHAAGAALGGAVLLPQWRARRRLAPARAPLS